MFSWLTQQKGPRKTDSPFPDRKRPASKELKKHVQQIKAMPTEKIAQALAYWMAGK